MDEVPVAFDMPGKYTVERRGLEDIAIATTGKFLEKFFDIVLCLGAEKCNFTVVLAVTANGEKCPPMIIFKRKTVPKILPIGLLVLCECSLI